MPTDPLPRYEQELRAFLAPLGVDLDAQAVVFQLYRTSTDVIATLEAKALRPLGLSHTGFALLVTIWVGGPQEVRGLARKHRLSKPSITSAIGTLERAGLVTLERAAEAAAKARARLPLHSVRLEAPVLRPPKFLAVGLNYADHVAESGAERPALPTFFNKQSTCVTGPYDPIHRPRVSPLLDYEGELGDPHALRLRTWVNGELRQDSSTAQLIFDCFALVEHLSTAFTLEPGDVIATGTPGGVGMAMSPPRFLVPGDVVRVEIERIGHIENRVVDEPADTARL